MTGLGDEEVKGDGQASGVGTQVDDRALSEIGMHMEGWSERKSCYTLRGRDYTLRSWQGVGWSDLGVELSSS